MGLKAAVVRLLSRGSSPEPDGDDLVEVVTVPQFEAPLLLADLEAHEIPATAMESFNLVTRTLTDQRILVPRRHLEAAHAVVAQHP